MIRQSKINKFVQEISLLQEISFKFKINKFVQEILFMKEISFKFKILEFRIF